MSIEDLVQPNGSENGLSMAQILTPDNIRSQIQADPHGIPVKILRSSGQLDDGWYITAIGKDGKSVRVVKEGVGHKIPHLDDVRAWNGV